MSLALAQPMVADPVLPTEETETHTRLLKCSLEVEQSRSYWRHVDPSAAPPRAQRAFDESWFGARSMARVEVLLTNFRLRYHAYPHGLAALHAWPDMPPDVRVLVCHWHLQLVDPLYRRFTGDMLSTRRAGPRPTLTFDQVLRWVEQEGPPHWMPATQYQFASRLLGCAYTVGLVGSSRDPRPLLWPNVPDLGLGYLVHLLRGVRFAGSLLDNPYARSLGLVGDELERRLRRVPGLQFYRMGELVEFHWDFPDLPTWVEAVR